MAVIIEKVSPVDAAAMLAFLKQVGGETNNLTFGPEGIPITMEAEKSYIAELENSEDGIMLTARENGKIIGTASLSRLPRRMSHRGDFSVCVLREHWGKGIGGQLLCGILDFAREKNFEIIDLQVRSDNQRAIHLYEKHGFRKIGTYSGFLKIDSQYIDFDYMCLYL